MDKLENIKKLLDDYAKFKNIIIEILAIKLDKEETNINCTDISFDGDNLRIEYVIALDGGDNLTSSWLYFPCQQYLNYLELKGGFNYDFI